MEEEKKPEVINEVEDKKPSESKGYSIASMVLGIVGLFIAGIICGTLAIIFSVMAKKKNQINGMSTTGLVLGIIDVASAILILVVCHSSILFSLS